MTRVGDERLPRDLVTILRTEAKNQRTPPIDYVIAEDGGRMVHRPEPDIAMAELLEEAAAALAEKDKEIEALREDAERYRCLSSMATQQADYLGPIFRIDVRRTPQTLFNFDAAVDHARRALTGGE